MEYGLLRNVKYTKVGGGFVGVEGDASGRVSSDLWKKRKKKKVQKSKWNFTPRRTEAGVFISARLAWIFIPAVNVF